jgi:SAM-dependent methyltransferase
MDDNQHADKQHTLGQFETPVDVADLLLAFCWRRPSDRLLDPSCGAGALLARAAQWQRWLSDSPKLPPDTLWGVELDPETAVLAHAALPQAHILSQNFFTLVREGATAVLPTPFDAIIGNPPYTRAEWIGRVPAASGQQLDLFADLPHPSDPAGDKRLLMPRHLWDGLGGRAGLHAYFFLHSAEFLREGGRLAFVVPNGWLDVAYGERLKQFLLDHFKIIAIVESGVERWFNAKINTCVVVLEKCSGPNRRAANLVRLVQLKRPLLTLFHYPADDYRRPMAAEQLVSRLLPNENRHTNETAVRIVPQNELRPAAKWGLALRAPDVYRKRHQSGPDISPLQSWATVQRGFTTGANDFFYLDAATIVRWGIEPHFRRPLLKSLRGLNCLRLTAADCAHEVLWLPPDAHIAGTAVAEYLAWGVSQGLAERTTCLARQPWYSLFTQSPAQLALPKGVWQRHMAPLLTDDLLIDQQLYQVQIDMVTRDRGPLLAAAAALLNSAWFALQCELHGRLNFGAGVLWLAGYELAQVRLPDPRTLPDAQVERLATAFNRLAERPLLPFETEWEQADREELETAVADALHFTVTEQQEIRRALQDRLATRRRLVKG